MKTSSIGVALGGGGVRGACHVGVLQELNNAGFNISAISGVSAGAIVAALYAQSKDANLVENKFRRVWKSELIDKFSNSGIAKTKQSGYHTSTLSEFFRNLYLAFVSNYNDSLIDINQVRTLLNLLVGNISFDDMKIPLKIVSTDLNSGSDVIHDKGDLLDALVHSCAIPGIMSPLSFEDKLVVDGGVSMPIPVPALDKICDFIIAVDIGVYKFDKLKKPNIKDIKTRAQIITSNKLKQYISSGADFVIKPKTAGFHWSEFDKAEVLLNNGRMEVRNKIDDLKRIISERNS